MQRRAPGSCGRLTIHRVPLQDGNGSERSAEQRAQAASAGPERGSGEVDPKGRPSQGAKDQPSAARVSFAGRNWVERRTGGFGKGPTGSKARGSSGIAANHSGNGFWVLILPGGPGWARGGEPKAERVRAGSCEALKRQVGSVEPGEEVPKGAPALGERKAVSKRRLLRLSFGSASRSVDP